MRLLLLIPLVSMVYGVATAQGFRYTNGGAVVNRSKDAGVQRSPTNERINSIPAKDLGPASTKGPFVIPYWTRGVLRPYAGAPSRAWLLYNPNDHLLFSRSSSDELEPVKTAGLREFSVGDSLLGTQRVYRRYLDARVEDPALRTAFFEVRYNAGRSALLRHQVIFDISENRIAGRTPLRERTTYYLKEAHNNLLVPISLTQEAVLAALEPAHQLALTAYASKNRLELTREHDVIQLLGYYGSL